MWEEKFLKKANYPDINILIYLTVQAGIGIGKWKPVDIASQKDNAFLFLISISTYHFTLYFEEGTRFYCTKHETLVSKGTLGAILMKIMLICFNNVIAIFLRHRSPMRIMHGAVIFPVIEIWY